MDQICGLVQRLQRDIQDKVTSTQGPALEHLYAPQLTQINDSVYSIHCPAESKRPSVEIVLFHGLQLEGSHGPYITSWVSRSQSNPELWVKWILEDEKLEDARILLISYDSHVRKTNEVGRMDMHNTCENLISDLIDSAKVGQDGCPVILVGHCLGGVLMKELCVQAQDRLGRRSQDKINQGVQNFLANVQGFFFYGSPHHGTELANITTSSKSPLFKDLTTLNNDAARRNDAFRTLRQKYEWRTFGIGETVPVNMGGFEGLVVKEASAREDMDGYYSQMSANHFNVCRPEARESSIFCKLKEFVSDIVEEDKSRQGPAMKTLDFGLEPQVNEIWRKLITEGIQRLGIVGMGGIGKTTLAKLVFNAILGYFDYTCFLMEVKKKTPDSLRDDIKGRLCFRGRPVKKAFKWSDLKKKRILIVLDDIIDESHVQVITEDEFLSSQDCTVIVTARDVGFLRPEEFECHSVRKLDSENSKKLFCKYAFKEAEPQYESLVERFLQKCDGLPLAIEVAGKYLYKKSEKVWIESLEKLGSHPLRGNATDKLTSIVNMSYNDLAEIEQEMFLDVAHCFHGQRLSTVKQIWRTCGWKGYESGWENLLDKGLVTEVPDPKWWEYAEGDSRSFIQMHELLIDLGLSKPCPDPPSGSGSSQGKPPIHLHRWISSRFISWREDMQALDIMECKYWVFLPRFVGQLERVEHLKIANCADLEAVPESVGLLSNLRDLSVQNCGSLSALPESVGLLSNLRDLSIKNCGRLSALPESLGDLKCLQRVAIWGCGRLDTLPESLWRLAGLEYLSIEGCDSLGALPESLGQLPALKKLKISKCSHLQYLPGSIGELQALQELMIQGCCDLEALPKSLGKLRVLEHLTIEECHGLETLPTNLGELSVLKHLEISDCSSLHTLPASIHKLPALQRLTLRGCHHLDILPNSLGQLQSLQDLTLERCYTLRSLPESLGQLRSLQRLTLEGCSNLVSLPESLWQLRGLRQLIIKCCEVLECLLWTFGFHEDLQHVTIQECTSLRFLPFGWPEALKQRPGCHFTIEGCPIEDLQARKHFTIQCQRESLEHLPMSIGNLRVLERLTIQECPSLEHLPEHIGRLGVLKHLTIQQCQNLKELPKSIGDLLALEYLSIEDCQNLKHLPENIGRLEALKHLTIQQCQNLKELPESIGDLLALEYLSIQDCQNLEHLPENIGRLEALKCWNLTELPNLIGLGFWNRTGLRKISGGNAVSQDMMVRRLPSLQHLTIERCDIDKLGLQEFLELHPGLRQLTINFCGGLEYFLCCVHEANRRKGERATLLHVGCTITIDGCDISELPSTAHPMTFHDPRVSEYLLDSIENFPALEDNAMQEYGHLPDLFHTRPTTRLRIDNCSDNEESTTSLSSDIEESNALTELTIRSTDHWRREGLTTSIQRLRRLTIDDCDNIQYLPDGFGLLQTLEHLTMKNCKSLKEIPDSIGDLLALKRLSIEECKSLHHLPKSLGNLRALEHLTITGSPWLKSLPESISDLLALKTLSIRYCGGLEHLPKSIGNLRALEHLTIADCPWLKSLPESIADLLDLKRLAIKQCYSLHHLPKSIGNLRALEHLTIAHCRWLRSLPESIADLLALKRLFIEECYFLGPLPKSIGNLSALEHLTIIYCPGLGSLPESISDLLALKSLYLSRCECLDHLPKSIGNLRALEYLTIADFKRLQSLPQSISNLRALKRLSIGDCESLDHLPKSIGNLSALEHLTIYQCRGLRSLPESISDLLALKTLSIRYCQGLEHLPKSIGNLSALEHLTIEFCRMLGSIPESIADLLALKCLSIGDCERLDHLPKSIGNLRALEHLTITRCERLKSLPESISDLLALKRLAIVHCYSLDHLPKSIGNLRALEHLTIAHCWWLRSLPHSISNLLALKHLDFSHCKALDSPSVVAAHRLIAALQVNSD